MGEDKSINEGAAARLTLRLVRRRKRWLAATAAGVGLLVGLGGVVLVGAFTLRGYLESPRFWQELSASAGLELAAATTRVSLWPLGVSISKLEGRRDGSKVFEVRNAAL